MQAKHSKWFNDEAVKNLNEAGKSEAKQKTSLQSVFGNCFKMDSISFRSATQYNTTNQMGRNLCVAKKDEEEWTIYEKRETRRTNLLPFDHVAFRFFVHSYWKFIIFLLFCFFWLNLVCVCVFEFVFIMCHACKASPALFSGCMCYGYGLWAKVCLFSAFLLSVSKKMRPKKAKFPT